MPHDAIYVGALLGVAKNGVLKDAIALTETASPQVRSTLLRHFNDWVAMHANIFQYMLSRGHYPAYQPAAIIQNDLRTARMALEMRE